VVADPLVKEARGWVTGANESDYHVRHAVLGRDFHVDLWADLVSVVSGDPCPRCGSELSVDRGIEVGHVFQLGTKYSEALDARYTDDAGADHPMTMGCYGIGVSRIVTAVVEEHHDEQGIAWPEVLAPYRVHLVALPGKGDTAEVVRAAADSLYDDLCAAGVSVLYDDRDASPGVKFADADLLGMPVRVTVGAKGLARGVIERRVRGTGEQDELPVADAVGALVHTVAE
jgi:prolyl-tRNA synthetase